MLSSNGFGIIYLDNAATTFPKPHGVIDSAIECISLYCANPGRSVHRLAVKAAEKIYETREVISSYLGLSSPERIVFTSNATHALNIAIQGSLDHKCHVIISDLEHNSVLRPLNNAVSRIGIEYSLFNSDTDIEASISELVRPDTEFLISTLQSNVTGKIIQPDIISRVSKKYRLKTIVDASQYLGHHRIDLSKYGFDILCAPGHKGLFGLQGTGILVLNSDLSPTPLILGGSGSNSLDPGMPSYLPDRYEGGTVNTPGIVSMSAGVNYLMRLGEKYISERIEALTRRLYDILKSVGVRLYGCEDGIASFLLGGYSSSEISALINEDGIATRSGLHCAPSVHSKLGTTSSGLVRVSLSILNTNDDLEKLYKSLYRIKKEYIG